MITKEDVVLVTGASGYIASWIVKELLELGCQVRGTVRDPRNDKKTKHLRSLPGATERLELVALDLNDDSQFDGVVKGVTLVLHTASPFPSQNPAHEDELIKPAVNGTVGILKAAVKVPSIRAVVITSSTAAIGWGSAIAGLPEKVYGESDWTDVNKADMYDKSKTLAEKAAWAFWNEHGKPFPMCTINPAFVLGPMLSEEVTSSVEMMRRLVNFELPLIPRISFGVVDVRDVAHAHVQALQVPGSEMSGHRFILSNDSFWLKQLSELIQPTFAPMGYMFSTIEAPYFALWLASFWDKGVSMILRTIGVWAEYDNGLSREILKIQYRDVKTTVVEGCHGVIYYGIVPKKPNYLPPKPDWTPLNA